MAMAFTLEHLRSLQNGGSQFTYLNGGSDWNQKEQIAGQFCADEGNYNDRFVEWGTEDIVINACFELCGDGFALILLRQL